jgi:all-trans-retinol 13,14-reductase
VTAHYDVIVIGAGMAGLAAATTLARRGQRVLVLEAHDVPGGYAHTFEVRGFRFCAQVHYIFGCGEGETVHSFLSDAGIVDRVPFVRLDPEGFDHVVVAGERTRVPNGLRRYEERLVRRFPHARAALAKYFRAVEAVARELDQDGDLPATLSPVALARAALRYRHMLYYRQATLADVYDACKMPPRLRAILAGQSGDYLLPPERVSFILHVALVNGYDRGAYYPRNHFFHFVDTIASALRASPGCDLLLQHTVDRIHVERGRAGRVSGVTTTNGAKFTADRYISNADPRVTMRLCGEVALARDDNKRDEYEYSCSTFTMYLAVKGIDLREHGFGSHNVWHYPHDDIGRMYRDQLERHDLSDPWLFMSTPSLHSEANGSASICPPDHQLLEICTACDYQRFAELRAKDRRAYNQEKKKIRDRILEIVSDSYVPMLRDHLALRVTGTPATNARYCRAPEGNAYGAALVPEHVTLERRPRRTSLDNLWLANATAGMPSVAGAIGAGVRLAREMTAGQ